jgi:16S rRNA (cytosine1402-N4)-methyltransferase
MTHTPVLLQEVIGAFAPHDQDRLLDGTLGLGGHTAAYLQAGGKNTTAVGVELDEQALSQAKQNLAIFGDRVTYVLGSYHRVKDFSQGGEILFSLFNHILLDLGIGSHQLADEHRGFSFQVGTGLSMRYGERGDIPPAQLNSLNELEKRLGHSPDVPEILELLSEQDIAQILRTYGEEKFAGRIARALKESVDSATTAPQLAQVIYDSVPNQYRHGRIHPATRTFQALRLAVNRELEILASGLPQLVSLLAPQGKIAVISFHSLEDRIVKQFFVKEAKGCICPPEQPVCVCGQTPRVKILTKKPIEASEAEKATNPRSRSAKMRIAQKIDS